MKKKLKKIIYLCFVLLVPLFSNVFYVATDGDDLSDGSKFSPWKSIQKAADMLVAGDIVLIKEGLYHEKVEVQHSGTQDKNIIFSNYSDGLVVIDSSIDDSFSNWGGGFEINQKSNIIVSGIKIINSIYGGIWIDESSHIKIIKCHTSNTTSCGIGVWSCRYITIEENEIEYACNDGEQECISVSDTSFSEVFKNHVHHNGPGHNGGEGIDIKQGSHDIKVYQNIIHHLNERIGLYVDAWDKFTYNIELYQNIVHHCGNNGLVVQSEMGGTVSNVSIYNNIVYENKWDGILVGDVTADANITLTPVKMVKIINNTSYNNGDYLGGWAFGILIDNDDAQNIFVRNNICSKNSAQLSVNKIKFGITIENNLLDGENIGLGATNGGNPIIASASFVDPDIYNFHLLKSSSAINMGVYDDAPTFDFEGNLRLYSGGIDLGAYEYRDSFVDVDVFDSKEENIIVRSSGNNFQNTVIDHLPLNCSAFIYSLSGRLLITLDIKEGNGESYAILDSSNFKDKRLGIGVYLLKITQDDYSELKSLVIY